MNREPASQLIIGPDGRVLAANGPLTSGLVDSRLEDSGVSPELRAAGHSLLLELRRSGGRMAATVVGGDQPVQVIAIEALAIRRTATDVRALLTSKLGVISSQAAEVDVSLDIAIAADVPAIVHLDSDKVAWAVTTLVGNALRYMRTLSRRLRGGAITVRGEFDAARSQLILEVHDNGPGVPADTVARLFKHDGLNVRGAGLALLLISDICGAHGGAVEVHSSTETSEHGTTVRMTFATH